MTQLSMTGRQRVAQLGGSRWVWGACFALLLISSPFVIRDLVKIQRAVEQAGGADFWYEGQLNRELLRLKTLFSEARLDQTPILRDEIRLQVDLIFNRLNTMPLSEADLWRYDSIAGLAEVDLIEREMQAIDAALPLIDNEPDAFLEGASPHLDAALRYGRQLSMIVVERQGAFTGDLQALISNFWRKLLLYGSTLVGLIAGLVYLMFRHFASEERLRAANSRLNEANVQLNGMADQLIKSHAEALEANRAKANFLANVSHELRTPLNGIIGFSDLVSSGYAGPLSPKQQEYLADIENAAQHLLTLINNVLDLSRLETGRYEIVEEEVDLREIVRQSLHSMRTQIKVSTLDVHVDAAPNIPRIRADGVKIRQIVDNLLSNAIKFTPPAGRIRIRLAIDEDGGIRLDIADTGIGIAADDLPRIFLPFQQGNSDHSRVFRGTGLGVPLANSYTELHDGTLRATSELGKGTTFTVKLPVHRLITGVPALPRRKDATMSSA